MQPVREVYSLLMPIKGGRIIVPRAAVAEVMGYTKPKERPDDAPAFVLGFVDWQGQRIPLVSFEAARGGDVPELGRRTRIAVVFGIGGRLTPNVFAVVTQGYPYLVRVNENVLHREEMETDEPLVLARVRMANEKPFVPNLEQLEALIADGLGIEALAVDASDGEPADELDAIELGDEDDFGDVLIDTGDDDTTDVTPSVEADNDDASTDINLGDVTSFGEETNYASELNELEGALSEETETTETVESVDIELGEVTAFGTETNYASELDELSSSIQGGQESETDSEDFAIDVSGLEVEDDDAKEGGEFDLSDLELDLEDEDDEKEKK